MRCRIGRIAVSVRDHRNGFDQVSYRPTSLFSLNREAVLARGPAPDQVERDALDQCHVARTIICFHTLAALHRVRRGLRQSRLDPGQQLGLVGFDGQQVVGLDDPLGDRPIAAGRVDRHQRALEAQLVEQRGDQGALVRLAVHDLLGQHEALLARVGRQGVQWTPAGAGVRFEVLPSIAIRSGASGRIAPIQASKHSSKVPGSSALTTSLSVSWLGPPRANGRIERKDSRFRRAQPAISTMLSAPARQPASAISRISSSRYNTLPRCRGSSTVLKKSRTVPEALSMTPSAKEGSYESHSLPGRNPKSATVQAIALGFALRAAFDTRPSVCSACAV